MKQIKTVVAWLMFLIPYFGVTQYEAKEMVTITEEQNDDIYLAGEKVKIKAIVKGDLVAAGGTITSLDSIYQDLIVAGGEIMISGYVADDIRTAGGSINVDSETGDDVIAFGGEIIITEEGVIGGNLVSVSGDLEMNGYVKGNLRSSGGDLKIDGKIDKDAIIYGEKVQVHGEIRGKSKIVAEHIEIGEGAKFYGDVEYWSEDGEVEFRNALVNANAVFNKDLAIDKQEVPWGIFGVAAFGFWIFYVLSAFLVLLVLQWLYRDFFAKVVSYWDKEMAKSLGYGVLYLIGLPLLIILCFVIIVGIPIGLVLGAIYGFSLLFGHIVLALLVTHYLNNKNEKSWSFWTSVFLAFGIFLVVRLVTLIPILGGIISFVIVAAAYGTLVLAIRNKNAIIKNTIQT